MNKCKLLDLSTDSVIVAEGRWESKDPKALVNGIPIGSKGVKVFLEVVHLPETFVWKPTMEKSHLEDCLNSFVAWPVNKIVFEDATDATSQKTPFRDSASTSKQISLGNATSSATGSRNSTIAAVSKTQVEKSQIAVEKSPKKKTQLPSQSPTRRSPVIVFNWLYSCFWINSICMKCFKMVMKLLLILIIYVFNCKHGSVNMAKKLSRKIKSACSWISKEGSGLLQKDVCIQSIHGKWSTVFPWDLMQLVCGLM